MRELREVGAEDDRGVESYKRQEVRGGEGRRIKG